MENNIYSNELEEMRQEIKALKDKVNSQGRLNEELVKKSIQSKMKSIHHTIFKLLVLVILVTPLWIWIKYQQNLSWPLLVFTLLMMYVSLGFDWFINQLDTHSSNLDMIETAKQLKLMKNRRKRQQIIGFTICIFWLIWIIYEMYQNSPNPEFAPFMLISILIGGAIGAIIGLRIYFKMQRSNDEMLEQIESLTKE